MRKFVFPALIAGAFGIPMLLFHQPGPSPGETGQMTAGAGPWSGGILPAGDLRGAASGSPFQMASASSAFPPRTDNSIAEMPVFASPAGYLDFRITPEWVRRQFPRVTMVPGEDNLSGMRVSMVSGPRPQDIHGSLTWYFDERKQLQRIVFRGWTGDPREMVQFVATQFGFRQRTTSAAGLYDKSVWGKRTGVLRLDYPAVLRREAVNEQFMMLMEIANPASSLALSQENTAILEAMGN